MPSDRGSKSRGEGRLSARQNARLRDRLEEMRRRAGLSERSLAETSGLSIGAVRGIGHTENGPRLGTLIAVSRALRLSSLDDLLGPSGTALLAAQDRLDAAIGTSNTDVVMTADL